MSFDVGADAYLRFMGRFSEPLAVPFADLAGLSAGQRVLDVGCGPGAQTAELVRRQGAALVSAVDPSPSFAAAVRERLPGVDVREAGAEELPFADGSFGAVLAQLVVHFMADPVAGLREMGRVAGRDGTVAACVWDYGGGRSPLSLFWRAARDLDPAVPDESGRAGVREGDLAELFARAGLRSVRNAALIVEARYASFDDWWEPLTLGVGPAGAHVAGLSADDRAALREHCRDLLPDGPIEVPAAAWAAVSPP
ncbi:MAG TPA: methyltransferase domain-containing protein [Streptosporangiaceae bacterium]|nr:methyltransferase domain-containing protein [Streptosporangiaceae bacterium]